MWLAIFLALSQPGREGNDAEQLFRKMEAALDKANALQLSFETTYGEASLRNGQRLKGTLAALSGNKLRLEVRGGKPDGCVHLRISDGKREILRIEGDEGRRKPHKTPKSRTATFRTAVARTGVLISLLPEVFASDDFDNYKEMFPVSGFQLGPKEKIGERQTQQLDYALGCKGKKATYSVAVWIDLKTSLPVKREVWDGFLWFSETYDLALDGKLEAKMFELPR
jgi:hypothetical protein